MDYDEADRAAALHQEIRREYERREADARAFKADMKEKLRRELVVNRVELLIVMPVSLVSVLARADHLVLICAALLLIQPAFYRGGLDKIEQHIPISVPAIALKVLIYAGLSYLAVALGANHFPYGQDLVLLWDIATSYADHPVGDAQIRHHLVNLVYSAAYATTIFHFLVRFISTVGYEDKLAAFKTKD